MFLGKDYFSRHPVDCARELIGCEFRWDGCAGIVVETEAYAEFGDEACHTFMRKGAREFISRNPAGTSYVYLNYGVHWLANVLVKGDCNGFVLLRALQPTTGIEAMEMRRKGRAFEELCSGPGKLTKAFGMDGSHHGFSFCNNPDRGFHSSGAVDQASVLHDLRIGISKAVDLPWRFFLARSAHVSKAGIVRK